MLLYYRALLLLCFVFLRYSRRLLHKFHKKVLKSTQKSSRFISWTLTVGQASAVGYKLPEYERLNLFLCLCNLLLSEQAASTGAGSGQAIAN